MAYNREIAQQKYQANKEQILLKRKEYYQQNKDKILARQKKYKGKYKEAKSAASKRYYQKNREQILLKLKTKQVIDLVKIKQIAKKHYEKEKESYLAKAKIKYNQNKELYKNYYQQNKDKRLEYQKQYSQSLNCKLKRKARYKQNPYYKLQSNLRIRINLAIKSAKTKRSNKTTELLGCSIKDVRKYLESLWLPGMNWENYSLEGWHIDHIIPVNTFDLTNPEQQKKCFHYTNLRPLWAKDNLSRPRDGSDMYENKEFLVEN